MMMINEEFDVGGIFPDAFDPSYFILDSAEESLQTMCEVGASCFPAGGFAYSSLDVDELPPPNQDPCKQISVTGDQPGDLLCVDDGGVRFKKRRSRSKNWTAEEKHIYLEAKVEALRAVTAKPDWEFISQRLLTRKFIRSSKVCEDLWGTLLKAFKSIARHESLKSDPHTSNWVSFWEMDEDGRSRNKLPKSFSVEWCKMMERILAVQEKRKADSEAQRKAKGTLVHDENSYLQSPANLSGDGSDQQPQDEHLRISDHTGTSACAGKNLQSSVSIVDDAQLVKQQVEHEVTSALLSLPWPSSATEEDELMTGIAPLVQQQVETAVNYALQLLAVAGTSIDEGDVMTRLAPFVKQQIKDALSSALQPVSLVLQVREQKGKEDEDELRTIAETRRALNRQEKQIMSRRRVGRHPGQHQRIRTPYKRQWPRRTSSSAREVIPAIL